MNLEHSHDHSLSLSALSARAAALPTSPAKKPIADDGKSQWTKNLEANPGHSQWFIERWETMVARGDDINGEARFIDALVPRGARIFDAGSGTGRVGGELHRRGHEVVGIDLDPALVEYANTTQAGPEWIVGDLIDTAAIVGAERLGIFDAVVAAGNVVTFPAPSHREGIMHAMFDLLKPGGRYVAGFGTGRGYSLEEFSAHAVAAGFRIQQLFSTWDLWPVEDSHPDYVVCVLTK